MFEQELPSAVHLISRASCGRFSMRQALARSKGADAQGLGRPRGGLNTKIHAATEALSLAVRPIASPGQRHDIDADAAIADKGYDADHLLDKITGAGTRVIIPPKCNRKILRS